MRPFTEKNQHILHNFKRMIHVSLVKIAIFHITSDNWATGKCNCSHPISTIWNIHPTSIHFCHLLRSKNEMNPHVRLNKVKKNHIINWNLNIIVTNLFWSSTYFCHRFRSIFQKWPQLSIYIEWQSQRYKIYFHWRQFERVHTVIPPSQPIQT